MMDEPLRTEPLLELLRGALPFPAAVTKHAQSATEPVGAGRLRSKQKIVIQDVIDGGEEGGILCIAGLGDGKELLVISITHLRFEISHPLYKAIRAYQIKRIKMLGRERSERACPR